MITHLGAPAPVLRARCYALASEFALARAARKYADEFGDALDARDDLEPHTLSLAVAKLSSALDVAHAINERRTELHQWEIDGLSEAAEALYLDALEVIA